MLSMEMGVSIRVFMGMSWPGVEAAVGTDDQGFQDGWAVCVADVYSRMVRRAVDHWKGEFFHYFGIF